MHICMRLILREYKAVRFDSGRFLPEFFAQVCTKNMEGHCFFRRVHAIISKINVRKKEESCIRFRAGSGIVRRIKQGI